MLLRAMRTAMPRVCTAARALSGRMPCLRAVSPAGAGVGLAGRTPAGSCPSARPASPRPGCWPRRCRRLGGRRGGADPVRRGVGRAEDDGRASGTATVGRAETDATDHLRRLDEVVAAVEAAQV